MGKKKRNTFIIIGIFIALLIVVRLMLPSWIVKYVNQTFDELPGYEGHITDVDLAIIRGAYKIVGLKIQKVVDSVPEPLFQAPVIDLSVEWSAIFDGSLVGEIELTRPELNFVAAPPGGEAQTGEEVDWRKPIRDLFPLKINKFIINNGEIHYLDPYTHPHVDVFLSSINASATNLTNSKNLSESMVANISATGLMMNEADFLLNLDLDPFDTTGTFNLDMQFEKLSLTEINDFLEAYAKIDAEKGTISIYSEVGSAKGDMKGYVKPLVHDAEIVDLSEEDEGPVKVAWEVLAGAVIKIFENENEEQIATKINFSGDFNNPDIRILPIFGKLIQNAFIRALKPNLEKSIDYQGVDVQEEGGKE